VNSKDLGGLGDLSMLELFRMEIETQSAVLTQGLIALEDDPTAAKRMEELMRAAHSAKGAARIVNRNPAVRIAHAMEDCFVAAQEGHVAIPPQQVDVLLQGVDLLGRIAKIPDEVLAGWELENEAAISGFLAALKRSKDGANDSTLSAVYNQPVTVEGVTGAEHKSPESESTGPSAGPSEGGAPPVASTDRVLRVSAENLNSLLGLAGEALVASRWLDSFAARMLRMKRLQRELGQSVENLRGSLIAANLEDRTAGRLAELQGRATTCQRFLTDTIAELDLFDRRFKARNSGNCHHGRPRYSGAA
jgi:two-component system, chemotaxis family, sensor histidine kinase and response regulator WspE